MLRLQPSHSLSACCCLGGNTFHGVLGISCSKAGNMISSSLHASRQTGWLLGVRLSIGLGAGRISIWTQPKLGLYQWDADYQLSRRYCQGVLQMLSWCIPANAASLCCNGRETACRSVGCCICCAIIPMQEQLAYTSVVRSLSNIGRYQRHGQLKVQHMISIL